MEQEINRDYSIYKTGNNNKSNTYFFQKFKKIRCFGRYIYIGVINLNSVFEGQVNLKDEINKFYKSTKSKTLTKEKKSTDLWNRMQTF